jgi:hypothetical protein
VGFLLNILKHRLYLIVIHYLKALLVGTGAPWILFWYLWRQFKKLGSRRLCLDGQLSELRRVIFLNLRVIFTEPHWFHLVKPSQCHCPLSFDGSVRIIRGRADSKFSLCSLVILILKLLHIQI